MKAIRLTGLAFVALAQARDLLQRDVIQAVEHEAEQNSNQQNQQDLEQLLSLQRQMQMNQMLIEQSRSEGIQEVYNSMGMPDLGKQMANTLMHTQKLQKIDIGDTQDLK